MGSSSRSSIAGDSRGGSNQGGKAASDNEERWVQVGVFLSGTGGRGAAVCGGSGLPRDGELSCVVVRAAGYGWSAPGGASAAATRGGFVSIGSANSSSITAPLDTTSGSPWDVMEVLTEVSMGSMTRYIR